VSWASCTWFIPFEFGYLNGDENFENFQENKGVYYIVAFAIYIKKKYLKKKKIMEIQIFHLAKI